VKEFNLLPDEGLCIDVLHTAARHGLPELASDVMRVLKIIGASWQEHHYAALIEALCRARRIKEAFLTLNSMHSENLLPTSGTTAAIFEIIEKDADTLDSAWSVIDEIGQQGPLDIAALNVMIQAAVALGDMHRAMGIYTTLADYHAKPNVDTFNFLLAGCIATSHRVLGDRLLADMKEVKVKPDSHVYENIVLLCLTQQTYEDAFFYLEEMKARKYHPTFKIYESLICKCLSAGDTRYALAMEEMKQCGYQVSRHLQDIIKTK
jgi:pentatricopeptide repeat protein